MNYKIRRIKQNEYHLLENFLYEAIYQVGENKLSKDIIYEPIIYNYIKDFGKDSDECLVAEVDNKIVGAIWTRLFCSDKDSYGFVDETTPELTVSLYREYRNCGIGTALINSILQLLGTKGYNGVSLSVDKDNPASKLYFKMKFEIYKETDYNYLMIYRLEKVDIEKLFNDLFDTNNSKAYKSLLILEEISNETDKVYRYIDKLSIMNMSDNYYIKLRGFRLICKQAKWDKFNIINENIENILSVLDDSRPTVIRQALHSLIDIVKYKKEVNTFIRERVLKIKISDYKESMHKLLLNDIEKLNEEIDKIEGVNN